MSQAPLIGYCDRFDVRAGESLGVHVSAPSGSFDARLVRLARRAEDQVAIASVIEGRYAGREQPIVTGSYMMVPGGVPLPVHPHLSLWVRPTLPADGREQMLLAWGGRYGLFLGVDGHLQLRWGAVEIMTHKPLAAMRWTEVLVRASGARVELSIETRDGESARWSGSVARDAEPHVSEDSFRIAAGFDGKIARPCVSDGDRPVAAWAFAKQPGSPVVFDESSAARHGRLVQTPQRGVTGPDWTGDSSGWSDDPEGYDAIAFRSDDLTDAGWLESLVFTPPADLPSDAYGIELRSGDQRDVVPFFILPAPGAPTAPLALLVPTFSYLAYANERHWWTNPGVEAIAGKPLDEIVAPIERWAETQRLISAYDYHRDGSGCAHASLRRPLVNMRAHYRHPLLRGPHQLGADMATIEWLRSIGQPFDIITDHVLHERGFEALAPYRAVMTGSHPEYVSEPIFDAVERYVGEGGRLIHLGGNAFYFVTSLYAEEPHVMEVRRGYAGTIPWQSPPGEIRHAATGEMGGLWRWRGRSGHRVLGTGTAAVTFGQGRPYIREPASHDPAHAWIFDGIDGDVIDAEAELLGGAAGFEVDAMRVDLGTPADTICLATATGFDPALTIVASEDVLSTGTAGAMESHIAYRRLAGGGRVFSAPSIAWTSCLADRGGDNAVARITANVIRAFTAVDGPPPPDLSPLEDKPHD
ncbi:MAG: N,N-dimethylformamidase beta subunit family domain-containing protein [Pseudomonadota bacterium]